VPATLAKKFRRADQLLVETFEAYGMTINWKPDKTEALVVYRGKKALSQKTKLCQADGSCSFPVKLSSGEDVSINVVFLNTSTLAQLSTSLER
jgi:hypothetical protein